MADHERLRIAASPSRIVPALAMSCFRMPPMRGVAMGRSQIVVYIETVDLAAQGLRLRSDRVGMVIAQPYLSITAAEPYHITAQAEPDQLAALNQALDVARAARNGASKGRQILLVSRDPDNSPWKE